MNNFYDSTKKSTLQFFLKYLMAYNRICIKTKIQLKMFRKQYTAFNLICEVLEYVCKLLVIAFTYLTHNKIEPSDFAWVDACKYLSSGNELPALTVDSYLKFEPNELKLISNHTILDDGLKEENECFHTIRDKFTIAINKFAYTDGVDEHLIIAKICPSATIVKIAKNIDIQHTLKTIILSSVRLLEIQYICGDLPPITIEVPSYHYVVDNEILSKAYILRYLEHLPMYSNWIFNENNYNVKIIDYDSNVFSVRSNQYILLEKNEYKIMYKTPIQSLTSGRIE